MTRTILLVEDNPDDVELTVSVLREQGIDAHIDVVEDGAEALIYLARTVPDLVLLDLNLPRMSGLDLLRQLRATGDARHVPVVVLTSSLQDQDIAASYQLGANSYVRKPVDYDEFVEVARKLGEYWLAINHPHPASAP